MLPVKGKDLRLYIATSYLTIASMLVQEDDDDIEHVYYLSQILNYVKIRHSAIEKVVLIFALFLY